MANGRGFNLATFANTRRAGAALKKRPCVVDAEELQRALGGAAVPRVIDRAQRVRWLGETAELLVASGDAASLFTGAAILAWLEEGGDLVRDYFQVSRPKSRHTAKYLWRQLKREAHQDERQVAVDTAKIARTTNSTKEAK